MVAPQMAEPQTVQARKAELGLPKLTRMPQRLPLWQVQFVVTQVGWRLDGAGCPRRRCMPVLAH